MNEHECKSYFGGRLTIESLRKTPDHSGRFRNSDERGEVAMIVANSKIEYVEFAQFASAGVKRGYHYHENYTERLYVLTGRLFIAFRVIGEGEQLLVDVQAGDLIIISPRTAHAFLSREPSLVLSMGSGADPFADRQLYKDFSFPDL